MAKLTYPKSHSEADVQFECMRILKERGFDVRAEVSPGNGKFANRLDIVIFYLETPLRVVEVKKLCRSEYAWAELAAQCSDYCRYGVGVDLVCGMDEAIQYAKTFTRDRTPDFVEAFTCGGIEKTDEPHACCRDTKYGRPCKANADRLRNGKWYCHIHDPAGKAVLKSSRRYREAHKRRKAVYDAMMGDDSTKKPAHHRSREQVDKSGRGENSSV